MVTEESIERFFRQQCSRDEANAIHLFFQENPEELAKYAGNENKKNPKELEPSELQTEKFWKNIYAQTLKQRRTRLLYQYAAIAASLIIVVGLSWLIFNREEPVKPKTIANAAPRQILKKNNSEQKIHFTLPDQTIVELMPNSSIKYNEDFSTNHRNVSLIGEALFAVARNVSRPFTVYSDAIATTALGTRFLIKAYPASDEIKVALYEGKVVVKPADSSTVTNSNTKYLAAGDALVYSKIKDLAVVIKPSQNEKADAKRQINPTASTSRTNAKQNDWYMFRDQPLSEVLEQLQVIYGQKIIFSKSDMEGLTFIGKIDKSDSLHNILKSIALLNNLTVVKDGSTYRVKK